MKSADLGIGVVIDSLTLVSGPKKNNGSKLGYDTSCACGGKKFRTNDYLTSTKIKKKTCGSCQIRDIIGKKFHHITVSEYSHKDKYSQHHYICFCKCGKKMVISRSRLTKSKNNVKSCGCHVAELKKENTDAKLIGKKFGKLIVLRRLDEQAGNGDYFIECRCSCGNIVKTRIQQLRDGRTRSCRCITRDIADKKNEKEYVGKRFGKLIITGIAKADSAGRARVYADCDCGTSGYEVALEHLKREKKTVSCGCYQKEMTSGENHWKYNPELTDEERYAHRDTYEDKRWRKEVYIRDNYECVICGSNKGLNAHHLASYRDNPDVRYEISNGVTLCETHHRLFHQKYNFGNNTSDQFNKFRLTFK